MSDLQVVILAAGEGTRMRSERPKALHLLAGKPLLGHVIDTVQRLEATAIYIVYGRHHDQLMAAIQPPPPGLVWVHQSEQSGTAHALGQAIPAIPDTATLLVLVGDIPLVETKTLRAVATIADNGGLGLVSVESNNPAGYGRIVRNDSGNVIGIVEDKDANLEQRRITEVNTGILAANTRLLRAWLRQVGNDNAQGEYYLTDVTAAAVADGVTVQTVKPDAKETVSGVNDRVQLARLERYVQQQIARRLLESGVTLADPSRFDARGEIVVEPDVTIDINVILSGQVTVRRGAYIGPDTVIADSTIGGNTYIDASCHIAGAIIGRDCRIGPFARLRPGTEIADNVHIGNFVEVKQSRIGSESKANHLSYLGNCEIGRRVNIGAGTITCNYDGANKHPTMIEDGAFIGSGTELVAPIRIGANATIGAGSTLSKDAPADSLTLSRSPVSTLSNWKRPIKQPS